MFPRSATFQVVAMESDLPKRMTEDRTYVHTHKHSVSVHQAGERSKSASGLTENKGECLGSLLTPDCNFSVVKTIQEHHFTRGIVCLVL